MPNDIFEAKCKEAIVEYFNTHVDSTDNKKITVNDVYIVWMCKTLQNNKAIASTTIPDGMIYEVTYNGDKHEAYVDVYKKWQNYAIAM